MGSNLRTAFVSCSFVLLSAVFAAPGAGLSYKGDVARVFSEFRLFPLQPFSRAPSVSPSMGVPLPGNVLPAPAPPHRRTPIYPHQQEDAPAGGIIYDDPSAERSAPVRPFVLGCGVGLFAVLKGRRRVERFLDRMVSRSP